MINLSEIIREKLPSLQKLRSRLTSLFSFCISSKKGVCRNFRTIAMFLNTSHFLTVAIFCCVTTGVFFNVATFVTRTSVIDDGMAIASLPPVSESVAIISEKIIDLEALGLGSEIEGSILPGETLGDSLERHSVADSVRQQIFQGLKGPLDFKTLRPGDRYRIDTDENGELVRCTYESGPLDIHVLNRLEDGTYKAEKQTISLERRTLRLEGVVESSLFAAFLPFHEDPKLIDSFADIFASGIDFNTETRSGDRFCLVFDKFYKDGEFVGYGKIRVARYDSQEAGLLEAYYFSSENNASGRYFDNRGRELGTSFIKSPVPMARVSSSFSYRRLHPILKTVRPHLGVDLSAPHGTPVIAVSDGKVHSVGREGGYGKRVVLDHGNGFMTYYGHLAGFAKGLSKGSRIEQKQVIGYVGSTGLATGPHLDYRITVNGDFRNPFDLKFKPRSILAGPELERFHQHVQQLARLEETFDDPQVIHVKKVLFTPGSEISLL